jgi:hypothetical protein
VAWTGNYSWILDTFLDDLKGWRFQKRGVGISRTRGGILQLGDQDEFRLILETVKESYSFINDMKLKVVSYKWGAQSKHPDDAHVVGFHGNPRPPQALAEWVKLYWGDEVDA